MPAAPTIGITVGLDPGQRIRSGFDYLYVNRTYSRAVRAAGGWPVLLPPDADPAEAARRCDGVVLSGGDDLPARLDGDARGALRPEVPERIAWERRLIDAALARERPLLGICYGMQLLNLHLGGTLHVDLAAGAVDHGGLGQMREHAVEIRKDSLLFPVLGGSARVSSCHHQAVDALAPGLHAAAAAPDGVIEALEGTGGAWLLGVEWHPEADGTGAAIYDHFLHAVRGRT